MAKIRHSRILMLLLCLVGAATAFLSASASALPRLGAAADAISHGQLSQGYLAPTADSHHSYLQIDSPADRRRRRSTAASSPAVPAECSPRRDAVSTAELYNLFQRPPDSCRPFVRWWWNGDKVEPDELRRELRLLKSAGIGGVEINPIEFPRRCDSVGKLSLPWLGQDWLDALNATFVEARRLHMQCDLLVGSGWPFGSEDLTMADRAQVMLTYAIPLEGGQTVTLLREDLFRAVDPQVTTPNADRTFRLVSLSLTPDTISSLAEVCDITPQHPGDTISIQLPAGRHVLYALISCQSFASVINGAPGASGPILDHLNASAVERYLNHMSTILEARFGSMKGYLRAYFVDSMELEGCNWTSDFAEEFLRRNGYDIMPWLPLISFQVGRLGEVKSYSYGAAKHPQFQRQIDSVRLDFERTKAQLFDERYTQTFLAWCRGQGVQSRAQAYGRGFFPLESSLGYDIPEGESWTTNYLRHRVGEEMGDEDYRRGRAYTMINKYVSSAAHLVGNRHVSAEEMTNTYRVFHTSLELLKLGSDMSALSGTTQSVWHGYNYSPPEAGFPGWVQYGSYYSDQNPWWPYFSLLNDYRARMTVLLQAGELESDIAVLLPQEKLWAQCGVQTEPFPNYPRGSEFEVPQLLWEAVHKCGGNCDLITNNILTKCRVDHHGISFGVKRYGHLLVVDSADYRRLLDSSLLSPERIILVPNIPSRAYLEWYDSLQRERRLPHRVSVARPDRFLMQNAYRMDDGSEMFLLLNCHIDQSLPVELTFPSEVRKGRTCWRYVPENGCRYRVPLHGGRLSLTMAPGELWVIMFSADKGDRRLRHDPLTAEPEVDRIVRENQSARTDVAFPREWSLTAQPAREGEALRLEGVTLHDLKDDSLFAHFMGSLTYTTVWHIDSAQLSTIRALDLGRVADICELRVNGMPCGVAWNGRRLFPLDGMLKAGDNEIEVKVVTLMGNYMQTLTDNRVVQNFVINRKVPRVSAGLLGPITIY